MTDLFLSLITEPPFTKHFSKEILLNIVCIPMEIPDYPCQTQAIERAIQLVTKASYSVTGEEARHELILSTLTSREKMPAFGGCLISGTGRVKMPNFLDGTGSFRKLCQYLICGTG